MGATLSSIDKLLKTQWIDKIVDGFESDKRVLGEIMRRRKPAKGGSYEFPVRVGRNKGIGFRGDGDTLPSAGNSAWVRHVVDPKLVYGRIQVSGPAMAASRGGKAKAFMEAFKDETVHTLDHMKKRLNIALWGAEEGYIAKIASVNDGADTITLDGPGTAGAASLNFNAGTRFLPWGSSSNPEASIDVIDSDGSTIHVANVDVISVTHSTNTIGVTSGTDLSGVADGDFIAFASGKTTSNTWESDAFEGIQAAIDDGTIRTTYHGLSRSTYPILKANVLKNDSALRDPSEALMEDLVKAVYRNSGVDPMNGKYELVTTLGIHSELVAQQLPAKRFQSTQLKSGHTMLDFNGIPVRGDVDCPFETMFMVDWDLFTFLEVDPLGWLDEDGRVLLRVANVDAYEARLRWFGDLVARDVHKMGVLRNLNDSRYSIRA